jgi:hypothetical protein
MLTFLILVLALIFLVLIVSLGLFMFIENKNRSIWIQQPQSNDPLYPEWYAFMQAKKEEWYLQTHDDLTLRRGIYQLKNRPIRLFYWQMGINLSETDMVLLVGSFMSWATMSLCQTIVQVQRVQGTSLVLDG